MPVAGFIGTYQLKLDATTREVATGESVDMPQVDLTVNVFANRPIGPLTDIDSAGNRVYTNSAGGGATGLTAHAIDPDAIDSVTYSLTNNAGGRFVINANTGVVTAASNLSNTDVGTFTVGVRATSTDGSTAEQDFSIAVAAPTYAQQNVLGPLNTWSPAGGPVWAQNSYVTGWAFNAGGSAPGGYVQKTFNVVAGQEYSLWATFFMQSWEGDSHQYGYTQVISNTGASIYYDGFSMFTFRGSTGSGHNSYTTFTAQTTGTYTIRVGNTGADGVYQGTDFNLTGASITGATSQLITPLVLDLQHDGVHTVGLDNGVAFDVDGNGVLERTAWVAPDDGLLVLDLNHDGLINDGRELFGSGTAMLDNGVAATDGFQALAQYDGNLDGVIDALDDVFAQLQVWVDRNTNGQTDAGELISLEDAGVLSIDLRYETSDATNNDNLLALQGNYLGTDGQQHHLVDVSFATAPLPLVESEPVL
jgi:hypothetical protein